MISIQSAINAEIYVKIS